MRVHTKKHRTNTIKNHLTEETSISSKDYISKVYENLPQGAVALAGLRYRENLTQKQLGELIKVKQSNISLMERGHRSIGKNIAQRLSEIFGVDYRNFL